MIINIRGTSGSGKSTIVREVMKHYDKQLVIKEPPRKQPLCYMMVRADPDDRPLIVVGHYETACGGCDTISEGYDKIYDIVRKAHDSGADVLYEGLLVSAEVKRAMALAEDVEDYLVLHIDIPIEECIDSINKRRWDKWQERRDKALAGNRQQPKEPDPVNPRNTIAKHRGVRRCMERLSEAGVKTITEDRDGVLQLVVEKLDL